MKQRGIFGHEYDDQESWAATAGRICGRWGRNIVIALILGHIILHVMAWLIGKQP